jgi:hypothetical protein
VENDRAVKIGISLGFEERLRDFARAGGAPVRVIAVFPTASRAHARVIEAWAHEALHADRVDGEWFWTHPLVAADVVADLVRRPPSALPLPFQTRAAVQRWLDRQEAA